MFDAGTTFQVFGISSAKPDSAEGGCFIPVSLQFPEAAVDSSQHESDTEAGAGSGFCPLPPAVCFPVFFALQVSV